MALTGTLEDIGLAELLQVLNVGHKSGKLSVWREGERAELFLREGEIVRASSQALRGPDVVYRLLGWRGGEFRFEQQEVPCEREIRQSTEALILEGMKRFDEWQRVEAEGPDVQVVLRQRASAVNDLYDGLSGPARLVLRLVDAHRSISEIVRESGLEPELARHAIGELMDKGVAEEWALPSDRPAVLKAQGRLPAAQGAIQFHTGSFISDGSQLASEGVGGVAPKGGGTHA
jgi:hypothetical protein